MAAGAKLGAGGAGGGKKSGLRVLDVSRNAGVWGEIPPAMAVLMVQGELLCPLDGCGSRVVPSDAIAEAKRRRQQQRQRRRRDKKTPRKDDDDNDNDDGDDNEDDVCFAEDEAWYGMDDGPNLW